MSQLERNKGVLLAALDAADRGDMEALRACFSPDYVDHSGSFGSRCGPDRDSAMAALKEFAPAFSDLRHTVLDIIAERDRVVLRVSATATHEGELRGLEPTGRQLTMTQTAIYRVRDGRIAERWVDGVESVVDRLEQDDRNGSDMGYGDEAERVRVLRGESVRWDRDASGGDFWELRLRGVSMTCFRLQAGARFPAHAHAAEQITLVLEGTLVFELDEDRLVLGPGDAIAVPAGVRHAVSAGDEAVLAVDAWSPPPGHLGPVASE